ncbi:hypothetical protein [Shewanella halifaxensis]|nr:hypothetical protein [Shewanella halifaxensis]
MATVIAISHDYTDFSHLSIRSLTSHLIFKAFSLTPSAVVY